MANRSTPKIEVFASKPPEHHQVRVLNPSSPTDLAIRVAELEDELRQDDTGRRRIPPSRREQIVRQIADWKLLRERLMATDSTVEIGASSALAPSHDMQRSQRKRNPLLDMRDAAMFSAIEDDASGKEYCEHLQRLGIGPDPKWVATGCPKSYPAAYDSPAWRQRIQDEKYRASRRREQLMLRDPIKYQLLLKKAEQLARKPLVTR